MKRFLYKSGIFIILISSIVVGLVLLSNFAINQRRIHILTLNKNITKIFSGDSNVECAVNDSLIPNSLNIAQSGEAYLYSYVKIKSLLEYNPQIKTIYIGTSYTDLLKDTEERWLYNPGFVIDKIGSYNYLMNIGEKSVIFKVMPKDYFKGMMKSVFSNLKTFLKSYRNTEGAIQNFGGYQYSTRDKLQEELRNQKPEEDKPHLQGKVQTEYLFKISELCKQKSVKLVLFNTPKHKSYFLNVPKDVEETWLSVRNSLAADSLMDFSALSYPDSCFGDVTHMNYIGARLFSEHLGKKLTQ